MMDLYLYDECWIQQVFISDLADEEPAKYTLISFRFSRAISWSEASWPESWTPSWRSAVRFSFRNGSPGNQGRSEKQKCGYYYLFELFENFKENVIRYNRTCQNHGRAFEGFPLCKLYWKKVQQNGRQLWRQRQKVRFLLWKFGLNSIQFTSLDSKQGAFMSFFCKLFSIPSSHTLTVPGQIDRIRIISTFQQL